MASDILQLFAKYNKNYQNVNSKRLQVTTVYFLTLNGHLALFLILTSDIDIHHPCDGHAHNGRLVIYYSGTG
jgi:hypothetical protein